MSILTWIEILILWFAGAAAGALLGSWLEVHVFSRPRHRSDRRDKLGRG